MKLLLDTNIFLEVILEQERSEEARILMSKIDQYEFFLSDYSLHSIGLLLFRRKQYGGIPAIPTGHSFWSWIHCDWPSRQRNGGRYSVCPTVWPRF